MNPLGTVSTAQPAAVTASWWQTQFAVFTPKDIALVLLFSLISSVLIALVYKKTYRGVLYNGCTKCSEVLA